MPFSYKAVFFATAFLFCGEGVHAVLPLDENESALPMLEEDTQPRPQWGATIPPVLEADAQPRPQWGDVCGAVHDMRQEPSLYHLTCLNDARARCLNVFRPNAGIFDAIHRNIYEDIKNHIFFHDMTPHDTEDMRTFLQSVQRRAFFTEVLRFCQLFPLRMHHAPAFERENAEPMTMLGCILTMYSLYLEIPGMPPCALCQEDLESIGTKYGLSPLSWRTFRLNIPVYVERENGEGYYERRTVTRASYNQPFDPAVLREFVRSFNRSYTAENFHFIYDTET